MNKKNKDKKSKASILAVTMIILGIMLITALSVSSISIKERKASIGETKSSQAFQSAQSGVEAVMKDLVKGEHDTVDELVGDCNEDTGEIKDEALGYTVKLFKKDDSFVHCKNDSSTKVFDVAYIKSAGTKSGQQRAILANNDCAGANITDDMVGHWKFDENVGNMTTATDEVNHNDAVACDTSPLAVGAPIMHPSVDSTPSFSSDGSRQFIRFNSSSGKNCAMIPNASDYDGDGKNDYQLQEGTLSLWFRYYNSNPNTWQGIFSKDANMCDTRTDPDNPNANPPDPLCNSLGNDPLCDCGHLTLSYDYPIKNKIGFRFQNDGNSSHYALGSAVDIGDGDWHLATLTFDAEKYISYVDGIKGKEFRKSPPSEDDTDPADPVSDFDSRLEALTGNKWRIWLGATYTEGEGSSSSKGYAKADIDDLRIYKKALTQCEVTRLYAETK